MYIAYIDVCAMYIECMSTYTYILVYFQCMRRIRCMRYHTVVCLCILVVCNVYVIYIPHTYAYMAHTCISIAFSHTLLIHSSYTLCVPVCVRMRTYTCTRTVYAHVCRTYARCMRLSIRMRVVCGTYVWCMGWSACMHTVYTICISYVCRVYADAYGGIGMYGMYVATYACMGRVPVVYALCMGSPAHTLYTHSHTSHIQSNTGIYMYR